MGIFPSVLYKRLELLFVVCLQAEESYVKKMQAFFQTNCKKNKT